jgi:hypothetical protein
MVFMSTKQEEAKCVCSVCAPIEWFLHTAKWNCCPRGELWPWTDVLIIQRACECEESKFLSSILPPFEQIFHATTQYSIWVLLPQPIDHSENVCNFQARFFLLSNSNLEQLEKKSFGLHDSMIFCLVFSAICCYNAGIKGLNN